MQHPGELKPFHKLRSFLAKSPRLRAVLLLTPALAVIAGLFAGGLVLALVQSLGYFAPAGEHAFTLAHYRNLFAGHEFRASLGLTFVLASVSTAIAACAGVALALPLRVTARHSRILNALLQVPIAVPHLVMAVVLIDFIAPSGIIARAFYAAGLIHVPADFPALINDRYGLGIFLAYVLKETPFIALMCLAVLVRLNEEYECVASTLGASAWQRFRHVTLPMAAPAVVSASLVVFAFIFGAFEIPFLLGRPYPAMLPVVAERRFMDADLSSRPDAIAIAVVIAVIAGLLVWAYLRLARTIAGIERPTIF
ncbi:MAG: ABC transporter permease [Terriglobia bacterium]